MIVPKYDADLMAAPDAAPDLGGFAAVMTDVRWPGAAELALAAAQGGRHSGDPRCRRGAARDARAAVAAGDPCRGVGERGAGW